MPCCSSGAVPQAKLPKAQLRELGEPQHLLFQCMELLLCPGGASGLSVRGKQSRSELMGFMNKVSYTRGNLLCPLPQDAPQ